MNTEIRIHPCDLWFRHSIGAIRAKNCTKTTLERKLHRQLHLPRIADTLSQEPVKVE
jgi:hypothetical protein